MKLKTLKEHCPFDYLTFFILCGFLLFGIVMVYDASIVYSENVFGGKYHFIYYQSLWVISGLLFFTLGYFFPKKLLFQLSSYFFLITIFLLIIVLIPSELTPKLYGARRWLVFPVFGNLSFQPSDLVKLSYILYLSKTLSKKSLNISKSFISFLIITAVPFFLIILQPDLGTALILVGAGISVAYISGFPIKYFLSALPLILILIVALILGSSYRKDRLISYLGIFSEKHKVFDYHAEQSLITIGSGGLFGLGMGQSRQKYGYLPEVSADSIFAVVCEEWGFAGALIFISVLSLFILRLLTKAVLIKTNPYKLACIGIISYFFAQSFLNIFSTAGLAPITGVPLPLISYGGSSLVFSMLAFGVLLSSLREC